MFVPQSDHALIKYDKNTQPNSHYCDYRACWWKLESPEFRNMADRQSLTQRWKDLCRLSVIQTSFSIFTQPNVVTPFVCLLCSLVQLQHYSDRPFCIYSQTLNNTLFVNTCCSPDLCVCFVCSHVQLPAALSWPGDGGCDTTNVGPAGVCSAHDGTVSVGCPLLHEY